MPEGERTEQASPRRRQEVRERGQVARSAEINSAVVLLAGFLYLRYLGGSLVTSSMELMHTSFTNFDQPDLTVEAVMGALFAFAALLGTMLAPFFVLMVVVGIVTNVAQIGFLFTMKPLMPDFSRVNPFSGLKRLFGTRSLVELVKSLAKLGVVGFVGYRVVVDRLPTVLALPALDWQDAVAFVLNILFDAALWSGGALLVIAVADYSYQRISFERSIRMSREEVREEMKQTEGNPIIRQHVRRLQRAVAQRRMMQAVPTADVVITNPTHLAVALKYESETMRAPRVVAKGEGYIAEQIKRIAHEHDVPTMENKPLAQALFKGCEIGQEIPATVYAAVAEILAFLHRVKSGGALPAPVAAS